MSITYNGKSVLAIYRNGTAVEQALIAWNWTPTQLYFGGVRGAAYVPDASTVYGAGAVALFGAGITTILDEKNGPPVIGPELVVNGDFTNGISGWTIGTGSAVAIGGELAITSENNVGRATQIVPVVVGKRYIVKATIRYGTSTGRFRVGTSDQGLQYNAYTDSFAGIFTAITSQMYLGPQNGGSIGIAYYSNISVREIFENQNPAIQTSAALRPLLGQAPLVKRNIISAGTHNFSGFIDEVNSEIIANNAMGPDNNPTSASSFQVDNVGGTGQCRWYSGVNFLLPGTFTYSIWLKKGTERYVALLTTALDSPTSDNLSATIFDLENGVISSDGEGAAKMDPYTNGWYRCSATFTVSGTDVIGDIRLAVANQSSNDKTINLDGSIVFYGYGYQVERGSVATAYQKVVSSLDITESGVTSYPFIRMDLSDDALTTAGLGSTKNLLRYTEEFDNAIWKENGNLPRADQFVTADATTAPTGETTADRLTFSPSVTSTWWGQSGVTYQSGSAYTFSIWLKRVSGSGSIQINTNPYGSGGVWVTTAITSEWQRFSITQTATATTTPIAAAGILAVEAGQVIDAWGAQLELGTIATAYEYGGFKGTALVAGRNGTLVENVALPDGNFTLGPLGVTSGAPGLLRAVGDIVGYNVINKTLTTKERKYLIEYYKDRGAKGLLVAGPELVTNGTFDVNSDGWTFLAGGSYLNNRIEWTASPHNTVIARNAGISVVAGRVYLMTYDQTNVGSSSRVYSDFGLTGVASALPRVVQTLVASTTTSSALQILNQGTGGSGTIDNISVKELRPEEEWV